jgi:hypothetical protein
MTWLAVIAGGILVCIYGFWSGSRKTSDFAGYYTSARILIEADSVSCMYDGRWFVQKMHRYGIADSTLLMYVNPPLVASVMVPLAWLPPAQAKSVWNAISVVLLMIAFWLLRQILKSSVPAGKLPFIFALLTCTLPFVRNLQRGQVYILLLVVLLLLIRELEHHKPYHASMCLAALLLLKYFGWMFLLVFLVERRWKELGATVLMLVLGSFLSLAIIGADTYRAYLEVLGQAFAQSDFAFTGLPCIPAFFGSLLTYNAQWNPNPIVDIPPMSTLLTMILLVVMVVLTFVRTSERSLARFSAITVLSVVFTPLAADHHYILMVLPAAYVLANTEISKSNLSAVVVLCAVLYILFGWYPGLPMSGFSGWAKLAAFPRLYAAAYLWWVSLRRGKPQHQSSSLITPV